MLGERINEIHSIEEYPLLSIIITTENGHYIIEGEEFYFKLPNFVPEKDSYLPKEFKGLLIADVMSDGEMLVIVLENDHYISRSWSFVTGDGQVSQAIFFHNDFYDFFDDGKDKQNSGFYSLSLGT